MWTQEVSLQDLGTLGCFMTLPPANDRQEKWALFVIFWQGDDARDTDEKAMGWERR